MSTVGLLGGGQLARMLVLAGKPLGADFRVFDGSSEACAGQVAPLRVAPFEDLDAIAAFAAEIDVATYDFENVPVASARHLAERVGVFPHPGALAMAQDRLAEKELFQRLGMATPAYRAVDSQAELAAAVKAIGLPAVLKTRRLGYDGKGQLRLRSAADADGAFASLGSVPALLEAWVPFQAEYSVVGVRRADGEFRAYPVTRNWHKEGILAASLAPVSLDRDLAERAETHARALAEAVDYVGVLALELFLDAEGRLLANEFAPRVHNSGHWTLEGAVCSQFENHVRAVLGLPLGSTEARGVSLMVNLVGDLPDRAAALALPGLHWHDYGKSPRAGRKVGHATLVADSSSQLLAMLQELAGCFPGRLPELGELRLALGAD